MSTTRDKQLQKIARSVGLLLDKADSFTASAKRLVREVKGLKSAKK